MHLQFFFFRFSVCIQRQRRRSGEITVFWRRSWLSWWKVLPSSVFMRQVWKVAHQVHTVAPIGRFHSSGQHPYKFIGTNERVYIRKKNHEDWFGTPTCRPPFHCFGTPIWQPWRRVETLLRPFPSYPKPLFQNEAKCEAIDMKMFFYYSFSQERFCTSARFESENYWNSEMNSF